MFARPGSAPQIERDHRQRRKACVKQLEGALQTMTEQHTTEERVQALLAENAKLREDKQRIYAKLQQIRAIADDTRPATDALRSEGSSSPDNHGPVDGDKDAHGFDQTFDELVDAQPSALMGEATVFEQLAGSGLESDQHVSGSQDPEFTFSKCAAKSTTTVMPGLATSILVNWRQTPLPVRS